LLDLCSYVFDRQFVQILNGLLCKRRYAILFEIIQS